MLGPTVLVPRPKTTVPTTEKRTPEVKSAPTTLELVRGPENRDTVSCVQYGNTCQSSVLLTY